MFQSGLHGLMREIYIKSRNVLKLNLGIKRVKFDRWNTLSKSALWPTDHMFPMVFVRDRLTLRTISTNLTVDLLDQDWEIG